MQLLRFILLCFIWLAAMGAMVIMAPLGKHALAFSVLFCLGHVLMVLMVWLFPVGLTSKRALAGIFALGILARLIFLSYPVGNDVFRYVWEGCIQNLGFNPFNYSPLSPALAEIARGDLYAIWQQINHPEFSAAYPPVALLFFRILAWLNPDPFFFKAVMIGFDIGVMIILMLMIKQRGVLPSRLLLYAANPLILLYISGEGHLDIIQLFFLCLALYLILYQKSPATGFLMLGLAILSKYFAMVALPFLVNGENRTKSLAVLIPLILYIPYMDAGPGIFQSLGEFGTQFHYNDSMTVLIRYLFGGDYLFVSICLLVICLVWVYLFVQDELRSVYLAMGCLLVFLPTFHPWYLVLIAPFLVFFPSRAWLYLQAAVVFTFPVSAIEFSTGVFREISGLKLLEYVPFYGLLLYGLFRGGFLLRDQSYAQPTCISAVIPTLNESGNLIRCLESLQNRTALKEIIVADGGSTDGTPTLAAKLGARVVESPKGRGLQIRKGVEAASGDVIVILHADCVVKKGVFKRILKKLESDPHAVGGAVGMQFEKNNLKTLVIAFLNNVRTFLTGISFGDQAQFFRTEALTVTGGFPSMMLMEDVELSLRLKEVGRLVFLRKGILVSGRRWQGNGFSGNLMTVFHLFTRFLIERRFCRSNTLKRNFYEIYYSDRKTLTRTGIDD
jgi:rSAM/selenodomain-associated transferase 2